MLRFLSTMQYDEKGAPGESNKTLGYKGQGPLPGQDGEEK